MTRIPPDVIALIACVSLTAAVSLVVAVLAVGLVVRGLARLVRPRYIEVPAPCAQLHVFEAGRVRLPASRQLPPLGINPDRSTR